MSEEDLTSLEEDIVNSPEEDAAALPEKDTGAAEGEPAPAADETTVTVKPGDGYTYNTGALTMAMYANDSRNTLENLTNLATALPENSWQPSCTAAPFAPLDTCQQS